MNQKTATPKDAAAVILLNQDGKQVLWAQRNPKLSFLGGWHAFPGGKADADDGEIAVKNADHDLSKFIACAVRELFEETGILLVRGGEKLTKGQRASLHDDLVSGRSLFSEILADWNLSIDAEDFLYTGFWTTPKFSPVRFKTRFFIARCPPKQTPYAAITELRDVEFIAPADALARWSRAEVLISPPVLIALQTLAEENFNSDESKSPEVKTDPKSENRNPKSVSQKLLEKSNRLDGDIYHIELNPRVTVFPLKTETLPPATHTNCFLVGRREFVVIDAASKDADELARFFELIDSLIEKGCRCREIIVSHLHPDHFGGETVLQRHLKEKFGLDVPLAAHAMTAESLAGQVVFQKFIADGEAIELKDEAGAHFAITALHTPGHARGHLCFYDAELGFLISSDNVVGAGTVVIAPPEGDMSDYLGSLERMKNLPGLKHLCGSHGSAVFDARSKIEEYIAHRLEREKQILAAIAGGARNAREIVEKVYLNLAPGLFPLAEKSVEAHLEKIEKDAGR